MFGICAGHFSYIQQDDMSNMMQAGFSHLSCSTKLKPVHSLMLQYSRSCLISCLGLILMNLASVRKTFHKLQKCESWWHQGNLVCSSNCVQPCCTVEERADILLLERQWHVFKFHEMSSHRSMLSGTAGSLTTRAGYIIPTVCPKQCPQLSFSIQLWSKWLG